MTAPRTAVRMLAAARIISITGGAAAYTALNFTILEETGSAAWVALALLLTFGAMGFLLPLAGVLGDRFDRRRVLIASDLAGALCFAMMAVSDEPAWLLVWAFLSAVAEAPFWSASEAAMWRRLWASPVAVYWRQQHIDPHVVAGYVRGWHTNPLHATVGRLASELALTPAGMQRLRLVVVEPEPEEPDAPSPYAHLRPVQ